MKKRVLSMLLVLVMLVGLIPNIGNNMKEVEARVHETMPDVVIAKADDLYPGEQTSLFFPDIVNVPKEVYADVEGESQAAKENGKLLAVYYKNKYHWLGSNPDEASYGEIHMVESTDNGETWSQPKVVVTSDLIKDWGISDDSDAELIEPRDPNLAILHDGTVLLTFFTASLGEGAKTQTCILESTDGGNSWGKAVNLFQLCKDQNMPIGLTTCAKRGDITTFPDAANDPTNEYYNQVLIPVYGFKEGSNYDASVVIRAERTAKETWTIHHVKEIANTDDQTNECINNGTHDTCGDRHHSDEMSLIATGRENGNEVFAVTRQDGWVFRSVDRGATWTRIAKEALPEGKWLNQPGLKMYTYEGEQYLYLTYGIPGLANYGRPTYGKAIKLSDLKEENEDFGWNISKAQLVYRSPAGEIEGADPSSVITNDGKILVVYYDGWGGTRYIGGTFVNLDGSIPNAPRTYDEKTLADFGINAFAASSSETKIYQTSTPSESFNGMALSGRFYSETGGRFAIGSEWHGLNLCITESRIYTIYTTDGSVGPKQLNIWAEEQLGVTSLLNRNLDIRMTFDVENVRTIGETEYMDLLFGITVTAEGGETYSTYVTYEKVVTAHTKQMFNVSNMKLTNPSYAESYDKLTPMTLADYNILTEQAQQPEGGNKTATPDALLANTTLVGIYNFPAVTSGRGAQLSFGGNISGLLMQSWDGALNVRIRGAVDQAETWIYASDLGGNSPLGRDMKMEILCECGTITDGIASTVTFTLIFDDLYTKTLTATDVSTSVLKQIITRATLTEGKGAILKNPAYANREQLTLKDFGVDGLQTLADTALQTDTPDGLLGGTSITGIYNFPTVASGAGRGAQLYIGSTGAGGLLIQSWEGGYLDMRIRDASGDQCISYVYASDLDGKNPQGHDLKMEVYCQIDGVNDGVAASVKYAVIFNDQYIKTLTATNVNTNVLKQTMGVYELTTDLTGIEPSVYPNCYLPQTLGATLATDKDVVKMGFDFADVIANKGIAKEDIASYGAVLVPGTKTAAVMQENAAKVLAGNAVDTYVKTEGDIDKLFETENREYYVTITNSGDAENMHVRATAIAYMKLQDGTIYYSTECNSDATQRVNKSVMGLLKAIFTENYVADYDAAKELGYGTEVDTPLGKAIVKYNQDKETNITIDTIKEIINRAKSTPEDRAIISGVHFTMHTMWANANAQLKGKYISILGHSIDTYEGVSNDATVNATIGGNMYTYGPSTSSPYKQLALEETWWMQVINDTGMKLLVNNSSSGSAVSYESDGVAQGSDTRATQLHADSGDNAGVMPDIIAVPLGTNDFKNAVGLGSFSAEEWGEICKDNGDGTYTYTISENSFAVHYAIMLHKMITKYPNADIFVFNIFDCNETQFITRTNLDEYNEMIAKIAAYFGATVVDAYNDSGLTRANTDEYSYDGIHLNAEGMRMYANAFEIALKEKYAQ